MAAIGSPFGEESSLAVGVVSATERSIGSLTSLYEVADAIQIDAPINRGNSGGPLFDARGRVIGINAQIRCDVRQRRGRRLRDADQLRPALDRAAARTGKVAYAYVGVTTQDLTPALARRFDLGRAARSADPDGGRRTAPAARAGLRGGDRRPEDFNGITISLGGDLIVAFAGRPVERAADVARIVTERLRPGDTVAVTVLRGGKGKRETVRVRLAERPLDPPASRRGLAARTRED